MKQAKSPYYAFTEQQSVVLQMQLNIGKQRIKEGQLLGHTESDTTEVT